jgi:hypothetical protein
MKTIVTEINEVKLIELLAELVAGWVKNFRFTIEVNTDENITDEQKNITPAVYKYDVPKRHELSEKKHAPINPAPYLGRSINPIPQPDPAPLYPFILIRPSSGNIAINDDGVAYEDVSIDIGIFVREYDISYRYVALLMAKKVLIQNLRGIPSGIVGDGYVLQDSPSWQLKDDSQEPAELLVITTIWRCYLPRQGKFNLRDI